MSTGPGNVVKITECPRDAMQGLGHFVPTAIKAAYINRVLQVGFDTVDFGSFVSPKTIPQMRDTAEVLGMLDLGKTKSKLLAIIANLRGADDALTHPEIDFLGYPFSISETFQRRNTNSGISESFETVKRIWERCIEKERGLRIYLSMGFGNPYGDEWSIGILDHWAHEIMALGISEIYLADTVGVATGLQISEILEGLDTAQKTDLGMHLHSTPDTWREKIEAAYKGGCRKFDSALKGYGGCPMAKDELTGNIATENLVGYLNEQNEKLFIDREKLKNAMDYSTTIFN